MTTTVTDVQQPDYSKYRQVQVRNHVLNV